MNDNRTRSILQRLPMILAVTAASYGLPLQAQATRVNAGAAMSNSAPSRASTDLASLAMPATPQR